MRCAKDIAVLNVNRSWGRTVDSTIRQPAVAHVAVFQLAAGGAFEKEGAPVALCGRDRLVRDLPEDSRVVVARTGKVNPAGWCAVGNEAAVNVEVVSAFDLDD